MIALAFRRKSFLLGFVALGHFVGLAGAMVNAATSNSTMKGQNYGASLNWCVMNL